MRSSITPGHLPTWGPAAIFAALLLVGIIGASVQDSYPTWFFYAFGLVLIAVTLLADVRSLALTLIASPLVYLVGAFSVGWIHTSTPGPSNTKTRALTAMYPAVENALWLIVPLIIAIILGRLRWTSYIRNTERLHRAQLEERSRKATPAAEPTPRSRHRSATTSPAVVSAPSVAPATASGTAPAKTKTATPAETTRVISSSTSRSSAAKSSAPAPEVGAHSASTERTAAANRSDLPRPRTQRSRDRLDRSETPRSAYTYRTYRNPAARTAAEVLEDEARAKHSARGGDSGHPNLDLSQIVRPGGYSSSGPHSSSFDNRNLERVLRRSSASQGRSYGSTARGISRTTTAPDSEDDSAPKSPKTPQDSE